MTEIQIDDTLYQQLAAEAAQHAISVEALIESLLHEALDEAGDVAEARQILERMERDESPTHRWSEVRDEVFPTDLP